MKFINRIQNISIGIKVLINFVLIIFAVTFIVFLLLKNLETDQKTLKKFGDIALTTSLIQNIGVEVSEIQRVANVFTLTGSDTTISKMKLIYLNIASELEVLSVEEKDPYKKNIIDQLLKVIKNYGSNIQNLKRLYHNRSEIIDVRLPQIREDGKKEILSHRGRNAENRFLLGYWYELTIETNEFLNKKKYSSLQSARKILKSIKKVSNRVSPKFVKIVNEYGENLERAIQANRNYLSLVNVVMTGSIIEVKKLMQLLIDQSLRNQERLTKANTINFEQSKRVVYIMILFTILIIVSSILLIHFNLVKRVERISSAFRKYISGDLSESIPGENIKDEVGQLAIAANKFKEVSIRMRSEKNQAEEYAKSKARFLATMSHEIRTPMNAIISGTHILLNHIKDRDSRLILNTIKSSGDSLIALINDILDYSKIEAGKFEIDKSPVNLSDLIEEVNHLMIPLADRKGVGLVLDVEEGFPDWVLTDGPRVKQVIINLLSNAIKFANIKVEIHCTSIKLEKNKYDIILAVKDDGIGIEEHQKIKLFKDFEQLDSSTTRKFGGTGLGLAISKGIMDALKGTIEVESQSGLGSQFKVRFTTELTEAMDESESKSLSDIKTEVINNEDIKYLRILMVEDNVTNQLIGQKIFEAIGLNLDIADNGKSAIEMIQTLDYDVIFMDQHMPVMDGIECTKAIRVLDIKQPKIVGLTASAFKEDKDRCLKAGMDYFMAKPIILEEVSKVLKMTAEQSKFKGTEKLQTNQNITKNDQIIDRKFLQDNFGEDPEFLEMVVKKFITELPPKIENIRKSAISHDENKLYSGLHTLKGEVSNFGESKVKSEIQSLISLCHAREFNVILKLFDSFEDNMNNFAIQISNFAIK